MVTIDGFEMSIFTRLHQAWAVFWGHAETTERRLLNDAEAELMQLHSKVIFSLRYSKDIPMALSDDITALGSAITNAFNAKQAEIAPLQQQVADLTNQVNTLTSQATAASQQIQALAASITPPAA